MLSPFPYLSAYSKFRKERFSPSLVASTLAKSSQRAISPLKNVLGMSFTIFILVLIITILLWICAFISLIVYWTKLPLFARVLGLLGLFTTLSPVTTLIVVYVFKKNN